MFVLANIMGGFDKHGKHIRLQYFILQVCEYFQDFDPLRSGMITKSQFRRGLSDLGLSALGQHKLTDAQFEALCNMYSSAKMPDKILWTRFMEDIESGKHVKYISD